MANTIVGDYNSYENQGMGVVQSEEPEDMGWVYRMFKRKIDKRYPKEHANVLWKAMNELQDSEDVASAVEISERVTSLKNQNIKGSDWLSGINNVDDGRFWKDVAACLKEDRDILTVLDVGCEAGLSTVKLAKKFPRTIVIGIDKCREAIVLALTRKNNPSNLSFVQSDVTEMAGQFDMVTACKVFGPASLVPHLAKQNALAVMSLVKPGGCFLSQDRFTAQVFTENWEWELQQVGFLTEIKNRMVVARKPALSI